MKPGGSMWVPGNGFRLTKNKTPTTQPKGIRIHIKFMKGNLTHTFPHVAVCVCVRVNALARTEIYLFVFLTYEAEGTGKSKTTPAAEFGKL